MGNPCSTGSRRHLGWLLFVAVFVTGCEVQKSPPQREFEQRCLTCGNVFSVIPYDKDKKVESTIEWCFYDGSYCPEGFEMLVKDADPQEIIRHCEFCKGCRMTIFNPDEWKEIHSK
jgi:hypothetical protein